MARSQVPFNITLLQLTPQALQNVRPVKEHAIFEGSTGNFHPDGLYSALTFGKQGDELRNRRPSYIDIKVTVFHPIIYRSFADLKQLYADIMSGSGYAVWNKEISDFERSDPINGKTGYFFFLQHWQDIKFEKARSDSRQQRIDVIEKYKSRALTSKIIVIPAGLRDVEVDRSGRVSEHEINSIYRKLLSISNTISEAAIRSNPDILDRPRFALQLAFNELYDMLESMLEGKHKLVMGKWASRRIFNGTRNVISSMNTNTPVLGAPGQLDSITTIIGLYQALKAALPVARYQLRNGFLSKVFLGVNMPAKLVNKKTLKSEPVMLKPWHYDRWMTDEGLEKVISAFGEESTRHKEVEIDGRYIGLIYKGPDKTYRLMHDIDELPPGRNKEDVYPVTFCELLYLETYRHINGLPGFLTRYPVTGVGSIYPCYTLIQPTIKVEERKQLAENWEPMDETYVAHHFPTKGDFINTIQPHPAYLNGLGADFDGDTASYNIVYSNEAVAEAKKFLKSKAAYISTKGEILSSTAVSTVELVCHNMTRW